MMTIIFIDLYLTLKNPFQPRRKRQKYYNVFLIAIIIFSVVIVSLKIQNFENFKNPVLIYGYLENETLTIV
jgi:uncharacterized membrane protein YhaH (DUF805 family)